MRYEYILFDLDGTLTDPAMGITNSVMHALAKYGIEVKNRKELYKFIGPPLADSFVEYYGFSKEEAKRAVEYYREYYIDKGIFENLLYDGAADLLCKLKDSGASVVLATSKPQVFAKRILEHFDIAKHFVFVAGSNLDGSRVVKAEVIRYALESCRVTDMTKVVMIGDRKHDIMGAAELGVDSIGVLYGYGNRRELQSAGAKHIVGTIGDIEHILFT